MGSLWEPMGPPLTPLCSPPPRSFPSNYWDKFVKRKVTEGCCPTWPYSTAGVFAPHPHPTNPPPHVSPLKVLEKYGDIYGRERIAELLGMELSSLEIGARGERKPPPDNSVLTWWVCVGGGPIAALGAP